MNIYLKFNVRWDYILSEHITTPPNPPTLSTSLICAQKLLGTNCLARCIWRQTAV